MKSAAKLVADVRASLDAAPAMAAILDLGSFSDFPGLAGALFQHLCGNQAIGRTVAQAYADDPVLTETTLYDIEETARRNFEPGGPSATLLHARGVHAIMAHRVAHRLWMDGDHDTALAVKTVAGRVLSTDIHPAARIGAGLWLDHGLGFVAGETSVIAEDVSIWHNVTLGSTLSDSGPHRHPQIASGAVIGAGALLLGSIRIGRFANIAAGAIVVEDVPDGALVAGAKASNRGAARVRFTQDGNTPK